MVDDRLYDEKELEKSWLISYSDLFTLLFVIIVIIAASSSSQIQAKLDEVKKAEAKQQETIKEAIQSKDILELKKLELERDIAILEARRDDLLGKVHALQAKQQKANDNIETVRTQLADALREMNISFEETAEGLKIRFPEQVLFSSGSAELGDDGKRALAAVADVLQTFPHRVRIEGYTDDVPVTNSPFRSNWELSTARAISVMRELVDGHGLPASRFMVAGWGEYKPLVANTTPENRALNRRVEMIVLAETE